MVRILRLSSTEAASERNLQAAIDAGLPRVVEGDSFYGSEWIWVQQDECLLIPDDTHYLLTPEEIEQLEPMPEPE
jgi:hypothetical protein